MEKVEYYFREISKIPRGSYNEKAICDYVENFAKETAEFGVIDKEPKMEGKSLVMFLAPKG